MPQNRPIFALNKDRTNCAPDSSLERTEKLNEKLLQIC